MKKTQGRGRGPLGNKPALALAPPLFVTLALEVLALAIHAFNKSLQ